MSPDVTLYGHWTCPFVHRVAWALAERGIDHDLDDEDRRIIDAMAPALRSDGLHFVGIDVVDGHLTEVNVSSPTGLRQLCELSGDRPDLAVVRWLERQVRTARNTPRSKDATP